MAIKLRYINELGEELTFSRDTTFKLLNFEGIGGTQVKIQSEKAPFQDGETFLDSMLEPRDLSIHLGIFAKNQIELFENRRRLSKLFNPKWKNNRLVYTNDFLSREIMCQVEAGPTYPSGRTTSFVGYQVALINLVALNPFWQDIQDNKIELVKVAPLLQFELEIISSGIEIGTYQEGEIIINNDSDVETPLRFEFPGPATDPIIINETTGEFVKIITPLLANERMVITTAFGNKKVEIHKEDGAIINAFQYIDLNSIFFQLRPGRNVLRFNAAAGSTNAIIEISYKRKYIGI